LSSDLLPDPKPLSWVQGEGDLGARLERILMRALEVAPIAIVVGTDSPGMPWRLLNHAHDALQSTDAVLGPCEDGGFYLLGLRRCSPGLLADIAWSESTTFMQTWQRLINAGLKPGRLDPWYDIDLPEDLDRLQADIGAGAVVAPHSARILADLQCSRKSTPLSSENAENLSARNGGTHLE